MAKKTLGKKAFNQYKAEVERLLSKWSVNGYDIYFERTDLDGDLAETQVSAGGHVTFKFGTWFDDSEVKYIDPVKTARHEFLHLILERLTSLAADRYVREEELLREEERLCNMAEVGLE